MSGRAVSVPEWVRQKAIARGAEGRRWLDRLGCLIDELERDWGMTVGATLHGGSESYVAAARTGAGHDAVVKLEMPPYESFAGEVRTLAAADGRGYARLLEYDAGRGATLQERLGPSLSESGLPIARQMEVLCATLRRAWEVPAPAGLQTGAEKARWLSDFIAATWEETNRPCTRRVVEQALAFAEARRAAFAPDDAVLVHGDAHADNALRDPGHAARARFKLVDPDGLLAEPAYDLAVPMREWSKELLLGSDAARLGRERCARLGLLTGVGPRGIWEWGFVERVSTGLLVMQVGAEELGREMLDVAEAWATS